MSEPKPVTPGDIAHDPRRSIVARLWARIDRVRRPEDRVAPPGLTRGNVFYGWYAEAGDEAPQYAPALGGPCLCCGERIGEDAIPMVLPFRMKRHPDRIYFHMVHIFCEDADIDQENVMHMLLWHMIERNGD